jgi:hypothetical protein
MGEWMDRLEPAGAVAGGPEQGGLQELVAVAGWVAVTVSTRLRAGVDLAVAVAARRGCFPWEVMLRPVDLEVVVGQAAASLALTAAQGDLVAVADREVTMDRADSVGEQGLAGVPGSAGRCLS